MPEATASPPQPPVNSMDEIVALCRRRGFIFQSSEIYGGINGFWDYGPMGARLKKNLKDAWWHDIVDCPPDGPDGHPLRIEPVEATIIMNPKVWQASGHLAGFHDPMVDDRKTKRRFRADHLWGLCIREDQSQIEKLRELPDAADMPAPDKTVIASAEGEAWLQLVNKKILKSYKQASWKQDGIIDLNEGAAYGFLFPVGPDNLRKQASSIPSPFSQETGVLTEPRDFNLMFPTCVGAVHDEDAKAYLRPETAQGIFTNFRNVVDTARVKVPFGIAQVGKAFRNEVTPRNFTFRSREFEQMEVEFFIPDPESVGEEVARTHEWYRYWRDLRYGWWRSIGLAGENLQLREHDPDELAHYAKEGAGTSDVEYRFPFTAPGFGELEGVAHRTNYDLRQHAEHSGLNQKFAYLDQDRGNARYFPHVIEPSAGADRGTLALLCEAYTPDESRPSQVYMRFAPRMAPIKAGVFPLVNKDGMPEAADRLHRELRRDWPVETDAKQSIGKRYARMDEAGTPYCFTIDGDTLEDQTVTVRDRDTQQQHRLGIDRVRDYLREKIRGEEKAEG